MLSPISELGVWLWGVTYGELYVNNHHPATYKIW